VSLSRGISYIKTASHTTLAPPLFQPTVLANHEILRGGNIRFSAIGPRFRKLPGLLNSHEPARADNGLCVSPGIRQAQVPHQHDRCLFKVAFQYRARDPESGHIVLKERFFTIHAEENNPVFFGHYPSTVCSPGTKIPISRLYKLRSYFMSIFEDVQCKMQSENCPPWRDLA